MKELDPILHSQLRLSIVSLLIALKEAEFEYLKNESGASSGNLSVQLQKLREAGYIEIHKTFRNNYPLTTCRITEKGVCAFDLYVKNIRTYLNPRPKVN